MHQSGSYRHDIDGLRAIAVLLVTIFHINESLIPGGFIGVDVFFVISGYLITGNIARDRLHGRFSFAEFYRRRMRRILPAMFVVTLVTLAIGTLLLLPEDLEHLSWSALATSISAANVFFTYFLDTSYFAPDSASVPLLHMWSLGVEEQFYLLWPIFLLSILKLNRSAIWVLAAVVVASIAIGEWQLRSGYIEWAYYMLPSRTFQLAIGGALFFLPAATRLASYILAPIGLGLIFASAWLLDASSSFPSINAVPVTIGTAALLASGTYQTLFSRALSVRPLRAIGLISYSLYLWHWPVLAFQRYFVIEVSPLAQVLSFFLMIALATSSHLLIEIPFRSSQISFKSALNRFVLVPSALLASVAGIILINNGLAPWESSANASRLAHIQPASDAEYVCQAGRLRDVVPKLRRCLVNTDVEPIMLMWGDSNAGHYVGAFRELAQREGFGFRNIAHARCPPLLRNAQAFVADRAKNTCASSSALVHEMLPNYKQIIISASWDTYVNHGGEGFLEALRESTIKLVQSGKQIVVIGQVPRLHNFDPGCLRKQAKVPFLSCEVSTSRDATDRINKQVQIAAEAAGAAYVDFTDILCPDGWCTDRINDEIIYFDAGHISMTGSEALGRAAVDNGMLLTFLRK